MIPQLKLCIYDALCTLGDHTLDNEGNSRLPGLDWLLMKLWFAGWEDGATT